MNRIKLLYDVARTMKSKEKIEGVLQWNVLKDQDEVFTLRNTFEKTAGGKGKTAVSTRLNLDGKEMSRESTTEFTLGDKCCVGHGLRRMFHRGNDKCGGGGIKAVFGKIAMFFGILSSMTLEELENGRAEVSIKLTDLPDEVRGALREKMQQKSHCCGHGFLHDCHNGELTNGVVVLTVNAERVIEEVSLELDGTFEDAESAAHNVAAFGRVRFAW